MQDLCGGKFTFVVHARTTVEELKLKYQDKSSLPASEQRLIFAHTRLEDHRTLGDYGIAGGAKLYVALCLRGG